MIKIIYLWFGLLIFSVSAFAQAKFDASCYGKANIESCRGDRLARFPAECYGKVNVTKCKRDIKNKTGKKSTKKQSPRQRRKKTGAFPAQCYRAVNLIACERKITAKKKRFRSKHPNQCRNAKNLKTCLAKFKAQSNSVSSANDADVILNSKGKTINTSQ